MTPFLIKNARIVDSGKVRNADLLIRNDRIEKIDGLISNLKFEAKEIDAENLFLLPGIIDVHVHFREPGLTHKADISSESLAAVAGGVTSFIEMPNTDPKTTAVEFLNEKFQLAAKKSHANYSFYIGATNDNFGELEKALIAGAPGVKIFMGASTGNMLVDNYHTLENIFSNFDGIVVVHTEAEAIIRERTEYYREQYGDHIPFGMHSEIRPIEACFESSKVAVDLAEKYNTRLHIAHLSTAEEVSLLSHKEISDKRITSEVCVHHLYFDRDDYGNLKGLIKCNPSIKEARHKKRLLEALKSGLIDLVSTDHAPHTWEEKQNSYSSCPSGIPLIQHSLSVMIEFYHQGLLSMEDIVLKMCHNPALAFHIKERGFIREGYKADLVLVDTAKKTTVSKDNILYKCRWSPFEGKTFHSAVIYSFVNGKPLLYDRVLNPVVAGEKLIFI